MAEEIEGISLQEKFNTGAGYYYRINNILSKLQHDKLYMNMNEWFMDLICLYCEFHAKCNEKEKKELTNKYQEVLKARNLVGKNIGKLNTALLIDFELEMRLLLDKKGMLTPKSEDPGKALSGGSF